MKLVVGLGNPGDKYIKTRHNLGFMVVEEYAKKHLPAKYEWEKDKKFKAEVIKLTPIWLVKPQTFMNNSGLCVAGLVEYFKIPLEDLIIIHDELDLPLGKIKVRLGGAAAGHHGVESIMGSLNNDKFVRIRLGIGNLRTLGAEHKKVKVNTDKFVTEGFKSDEKSKVKHMLKQAVSALELLLNEGLEKAQNQFN